MKNGLSVCAESKTDGKKVSELLKNVQIDALQ